MQYTSLNLQEIRELTKQYNIDEILSFNILSGGSENTNYLIASNTEKYVLTICEQKTTTEAINLCRLLGHLIINYFSTSKVIPTKKNEFITTYHNKPIILKTFLEGEVIKDLSNDLIELIGIQLGKLHKIKAPDYLPKKLSYGIESFKEIAIYDEDSLFHKWLLKIQNQVMPYMTESIPKTLIHSDIFYNNVIIGNDRKTVVIMDFEEAAYYYRIYDIGMAIIGLCSENESININKVASLLKGYIQEIDLTYLEQNALQTFTVYAAASMSFWRHKNFNYTKPTPKMKNHYLELKNIADYINNLPQDCFVKLLKN
jgi:homoserine kinase type II